MIELTSIDQALSLLRDKLKEMGDPPFHYVGNRGTDSYALISILEKIDYPLDTVVCLDDSGEHEHIPAGNIISIEKYKKRRTNRYSSLWRDSLFQASLKKEGIDLAPGSLLFCFSNFPELEFYCQKNRVRILSPTSVLRNGFESKVQLMYLLSDEKIRSLPSMVIELKDVDFETCCRHFNTDELVFQVPVSASGNGTHIIRGKKILCSWSLTSPATAY